MTENHPVTATKKKEAIETRKALLWGLSCFLAGCSVGIIAGIMLPQMDTVRHEDNLELAKSASAKIGWPVMERVIAVTDAQLQIGSMADAQNKIESSLTQRFEFLEKTKQATQVSSIPAPKKSGMVSIQAKPTSNTKYRDGSGPDDINTATFDKLDKVPYLKAETANEIIKFIKTKGRISNFDQLGEVKGVGPKTIEKLRQYFHIK
ncbi:MAG TPA: helix-hairpin-helix domain-containing protein [Caldisericia bacterium]|nr:helix-hairpin-helix domain-containing protein [Caldisericia bacterium]HOU07904.1 helix-hairpin-helix domain-containing protein [Caldisericia bacterium]HPL90277.1 helix-hairpin-helix domain-containing protein [Caldisericia bacterium]HQG59619.1 helix-hairpin-helix domain-containing protein [Caldisericia bacterium]HQH48861.1 helix-hairpin-helix domain-containing protein [Caldisericia bacterium]